MARKTCAILPLWEVGPGQLCLGPDESGHCPGVWGAAPTSPLISLHPSACSVRLWTPGLAREAERVMRWECWSGHEHRLVHNFKHSEVPFGALIGSGWECSSFCCHHFAAQRPMLLIPSSLQTHSQLGTPNCRPAAWEALTSALRLTSRPSPQLPL